MAGSTPTVSPLAPAAFPDLPQIDGIKFASAAAGVKYAGRDDVMLAVIEPGAAIAGVFTRSSTRSAPVLDCQAKLAASPDSASGMAILVNSGNSNAFTGHRGQASVEALCKAASETLNLPQSNIFTASTGVIGEPLPHERIIETLGALKSGLSAAKAESAARAIMTTDTFAKGATAQVEIQGQVATISGFAKGSGMIAPDMATMLVYIFTDAAISQPELQAMLSRLNAKSFNAITVDSDTSTSDSLMLVASGKGPSVGSADTEAFETALENVMLDLAHQVVRDGEGATKFIEVNVTGAETLAGANAVARAIANSPLVKTAIAGEDPNWGRIVMAVGKSGAAAERDRLQIRFGDIIVAEQGWVSPDYTEEAGAAYMKNDEIIITVDLGLGNAEATIWTCDLTHGYITINADYRS